MAQGAVASLPANGIRLDQAQAIHEIAELAKIVRFRDTILAGQHPKFKVPAGGLGLHNAASSSSHALPPPLPAQVSTTNSNTIITAKEVTSGSPYQARSADLNRLSNGTGAPNGAKSTINPVLLGKSEDLIKAEIQLRRQRLERVLRDHVEQRRLSAKAALQTSESLPDFDLSDVLFKALTIVHPSTTAEAEPSVGARSATDSFDDNTFYSSQHDTPELNSPRPVVKGTEDSVHNAISTDTHMVDSYGRDLVAQTRDMIMGNIAISSAVDAPVQEHAPKAPAKLPPKPLTQSSAPEVPHPTARIQDLPPAQYGRDFVDITFGEPDIDQLAPKAHPQRGQTSGVSTPSSHSRVDIGAVQNTNRQLIQDAFPPSPRIFSANPLDIVAPQPAHVSPLVIHQTIPSTRLLANADTSLQDPAPIASSPDSSPKPNKSKDKKKKKKEKKRKSTGKGSAIQTPDTPYIKPEPRSPSPFVSVPLQRPSKRQRHSLNQNQGQGLNYDEPSNEDSSHEIQVHQGPRHIRNQRSRQQPQAYDRPEEQRVYEPVEPQRADYRRQARDEPQYRRVVSHDVNPAPQDSNIYRPGIYPTYEEHAARAPSIVVMDRPPQESPRYYREEVVVPRTVIRSTTDRERSRSPVMRERRSPLLMAPPSRAVPRRIIIDEYGRQFYAPEPAQVRVVPRQSVAPYPASYARQGDDEIVYERPARVAAPRPAAETFEEDGIIYRRASPLGAPTQRRIVTQPEYEPEYRSYRQREYSARPTAMAPQADEYARPAQPIARRQMSHFEAPPRSDYRAESVRPERTQHEPAREYAPSRMQSVRPDTLQYDGPREYAGRLQSVRPEQIPHGYPSSAISRPDSRADSHMPPQHGMREYSVKPVEQEYPPREYIPQAQHSGYGTPVQHDPYGPPPRQVIRRVVSGADYTEQPRDVQHQGMYQEAPREIMYR